MSRQQDMASAEEYTLKGAGAAGLTLFCRRWKPDAQQFSKPRSLIFLSHGFAEHSAYYEALGSRLRSEGHLAIAHDHVGHGKSDGSRGHVDTVDDYVADVLAHLEHAQSEMQDDAAEPAPESALPPVFLLGHSMGGTIILKAAILFPGRFRGLVLVAPAVGLESKMASPFMVWIARFVSYLLPHFGLRPVDWTVVTRNRKMVEEYKKDNLCFQGRVKAKWGMAMINAIKEVEGRCSSLDCPFLLLQGTSDVLTPMASANAFYEATPGGGDKKLKVFEGAAHNLLQEEDDVREDSLKEICQWIDQRIPRQ